MEAQEKEVEFYETADGKRPFQEWLDSLSDRQGKAKIRVRIDRVALGNLGYCRSVGSGVMELKIDFGPGYRAYFGQIGNRLVVLLCGGDKSTQEKDIKTAQEYWTDYRRRHG
jgi:putative addiction module killer protein